MVVDLEPRSSNKVGCIVGHQGDDYWPSQLVLRGFGELQVSRQVSRNEHIGCMKDGSIALSIYANIYLRLER
jgi:hypothetical protein